jgi:hypothetical protein
VGRSMVFEQGKGRYERPEGVGHGCDW